MSAIDAPSKRMSPVTSALDGSKSMTAFMETDFPEPDSPTIPNAAPRSTASERFFTA